MAYDHFVPDMVRKIEIESYSELGVKVDAGVGV